jgi:peptidoglycan/xylan/chitin deacetylase (PgdA/CDA1 family)
MLKLLGKYNIKATFFTPAHTIESFPKQLAKVRDAGHEMLAATLYAKDTGIEC